MELLNELLNKLLFGTGVILFAVAGSCVKWLNSYKESPVSVKLLVIEAVTAAFSGGLICGLHTWLQFPKGAAFVLGGLAGWMGANSIELVIKNAAKRLGFDLIVKQKSYEEMSTEELHDRIRHLENLVKEKTDSHKQEPSS